VAISNLRQNWSDDWFSASFDLTAVNDLVDVTFPTPIREFTLQRSLDGPSAATVLIRSSLSFDQTQTITFGTANSDAMVSSSSHCLRRMRLICTVFTGSGTVKVAFVARRRK
jgi:hypothetical protein